MIDFVLVFNSFTAGANLHIVLTDDKPLITNWIGAIGCSIAVVITLAIRHLGV